ncbi:WD40 repeat domain-containing protein, partial [Thermopolyspora sp. NPDC052614]|uniref:WD40 repeat domain-containing protein n=1 Tax=Thermopolyspora sp. NPDC052614 TaxID=3155682 RepID=UPI003444AF89
MIDDLPAGRRLEFFPVALGAYRHRPAWNLENAQAETEQVAALLRDFGAEPVNWTEPMAERGADAIDARMRHWACPPSDPPADTFLYWAGHGRSDGLDAALAHAGTPADFTDSVIGPAQMALWIRNRAVRAEEHGTWAVVVVEACRSGDFVRLVSAELERYLRVRPRALLVGVTGSGPSGGSTNLGVFRRELRNVLHNDFGASPSIPLADLASALVRRLGEATVRPLDLPEGAALHRRTFTPTGVTVDAADEIAELLRALPDAERLHFVPKAQGAELGEVAWFFQGRDKERRRICDWLRRSEDGLFVVTGKPGTGKSALLGHLVVTSRPRLRAALTAQGHIPELSEADRPPDDIFDAVLHLTGASAGDVARDLAHAAGVDDLAADAPIHELADQLTARLSGANQPLTVLVDALDEAQQPLVIARLLLRPLAGLPGVRVIVGTRASTMEGPDHPGPATPDLLDALAPAEDRVLTVAADRFAIHPYVARRLRHLLHDDPRYAAGIDRAALLIADGAHEFLFARLAVHELQARRDLLVPGREDDLDAFLAGDHRALFARAVERHRAANPRRVPLLEALGLAQGRGLPILDDIWATVADALIDADTTPTSGPDIDDLIEAAAPYLVRDTEHGQTVYRLAHATFAEHFAAAETPDGDERHHHITTRFIQSIKRGQETPGTEAQTAINPYLCHHLPGHAARGGIASWQELAAHPRVLDELDPGRVATAAMAHALGRYPLPAEVAGVVGMRHLLDGLPPAQRIGLRQLGSVRHAGMTRPATTDLPHPDAVWSLRWAQVTPHAPHLTLAGHSGGVWAVAAFPSPDGRTLLATGGEDGTVRIWDTATGTAQAELTGHDRGVLAVAAFPSPHGRTLLATGGEDGTVRIWDTATGTARTVLTGHDRGVLAVAAFPSPHGRTLLATGGEDGTVRIWDTATGTARTVLTGHDRGVLAVAA